MDNLSEFLKLSRPRQDQEQKQPKAPGKRKKATELLEQQPIMEPAPVETPASHPILSSIAGAGNFLDLPGSMVRDTLALRNPFDQILTPFSDQNRVTGRDLNRMYGLSGQDDNWGNFAGGMATEILTDPTTYLTLGITGAGKAVATSGGNAVAKAGLAKYAKDAAKAAGKIPEPGLVQKAISKVTKKAPEAKLTARAARGLATPADILVHISREEGMDAAKTALDMMRKGGLTDDAMNTSIGGVFQLNAPFKSTGMKKGLPNIINKITGKNTFIDGVAGAKKFDDIHGEELAKILNDAPYTPVNPKEMAKKSRLSKVWAAIAGSKLKNIEGEEEGAIREGMLDAIKEAAEKKKASATPAEQQAEAVVERPAAPPSNPLVSKPPADEPDVGMLPKGMTGEELNNFASLDKSVYPDTPVTEPTVTPVNKLLGDNIKTKKSKKGRESKAPTKISQAEINFPAEKMSRLKKLRNDDIEGNIGIEESEELSNLERELAVASRPAKQATQLIEPAITTTPEVAEAVARQQPVESVQPQVDALPKQPPAIPKAGPLAGFKKGATKNVEQVQDFTSAKVDDVIAPEGIGEAVPPADEQFTWLPEQPPVSQAPEIRDLIEQHQYVMPSTPEGRVPRKSIPNKYERTPEYKEIIEQPAYKEAMTNAQRNAYVRDILRPVEQGEVVRVNGVGENQSKFMYDLSKSEKPGHIKFTQIDFKTGKPTGAARDVRADKDIWKYATVNTMDRNEILKTIGVAGQKAEPIISNLTDESVSKLESLRPYMATIARKSGKDESSINDIIQTTMSRLVTKGDNIMAKGDEEVKKYVAATVKNVIIDSVKSKKSKTTKAIGKDIEGVATESARDKSLDEFLGGDYSYENVTRKLEEEGIELGDVKLKALKKDLFIRQASQSGDQIEEILKSAKAEGIKIGKKDRTKIEKGLTKGTKNEEAIEGLLPRNEEAIEGSSIPAPSIGSEEVGRQSAQEVVSQTPVLKGLTNGEETNGQGLRYAEEGNAQGRNAVPSEGSAQEAQGQVGKIADEPIAGLGKEAGPAVDESAIESIKSIKGRHKYGTNEGASITKEIDSILARASDEDLQKISSSDRPTIRKMIGAYGDEGKSIDIKAKAILKDRSDLKLSPAELIAGMSQQQFYGAAKRGSRGANSAAKGNASEAGQMAANAIHWNMLKSDVEYGNMVEEGRSMFDLSKYWTQDAIKKAQSEISERVKKSLPVDTTAPKFTADDLIKNLNVQEKDYAKKVLEAAAEASGESVDDYVAKRYSPASKEMPFEEFKDDALFQSSEFPRTQKNELGFYSKAARVIDKKVQGATSYEQLIKTLENNGVRKEEIEDLGLEAFAGKKKILRNELAEYIEKNTPELIEVTKGAGSSPVTNIQKTDALWFRVGVYGSSSEKLKDGTPINIVRVQGETLFDEAGKPYSIDDIDTSDYAKAPNKPPQYSNYQPGGDIGEEYREFIYSLPGEEKYTSPHWREANPILHIRTRDRTIPGGKRMLEVMEVQSDWHQAGRADGYEGEWEKLTREFNRVTGLDMSIIPDSSRWKSIGMSDPDIARLSPEYNRLSSHMRLASVADAPLKKSWDRMALKRILSLAAKEGYDSIGIVKGEDIANVVGGPKEALGKFYNDKLLNEMKALTKKHESFQGIGNIKKQPKKEGLDIDYDDIKEQDESFDVYGVFENEPSHVNYSAYFEEGKWHVDTWVSGHGHKARRVGLFDSKQDAVSAIEKDWKTQDFDLTKSDYSGDFSHFEISPEMRKEIVEEGFPLYQNRTGDIKQGATRFAEDSKAIVNTFTGAHNFSTFIHEFGHVARRSLASNLNTIAEKELGVIDGSWTVEAEEKFSRGLERYMRDGKAPTEGLKAVFEGIKSLMMSIYKKLKGTPIEAKISKEMKSVYDAMFTPGKNVKTYDEAAKIQNALFQSTSAPSGIDDWATNTLQSIGELEDVIGKSAPMQALNALFDHRYRGIMSSTIGDKVAKQVEGEEKAIQQARKDIAPFNPTWLKATAMDPHTVYKSVYEEMKDVPGVTSDQMMVETRRRVNTVSNKVREFIEGFTDDLPPELDSISVEFKRAVENLKTIMGKADTVPPELLAQFLQRPLEETKLMQVRNAKDLARVAEIPIEEATTLLGDYNYNLTGLLREEQEAGIKASYLEDMFRQEYGVGRQASPVPAKTLVQGMKDLLKSIFGEENMIRFDRTEKNLNKNTKSKSGIHRDPSIGEFLEPHHHHQSQVKDVYRNIPVGTSMLNRLSLDEKISGIYHAQRTTDGRLAKKVTGQADGAGDPIMSVNDIVKHIKENYPEMSEPMARIKSADPNQLISIRQSIQTDPNALPDNESWIKAVKEQLGDAQAAELKKELANQEALDMKLPALAEAIANLDPRHATMQVPLFSNDFLGTALGRMELGRQAISAARVIQEVVTEVARPRHEVNNLDFRRHVEKSIKDLYENDITHPTVLKLLKDKELNTTQARENILDTLRQTQAEAVNGIEESIITSREEILDKTGFVRWRDKFGNAYSITKDEAKDEDGKTVEKWLYRISHDPDKQEKFGLEAPKKSILKGEQVDFESLEEAKEFIKGSEVDSSEILHNFVIPDEHAKDIEKVMRPLKIRDEHKILVNIFDKYLKFWKSMHTGVLPFISFHVRNRLSGIYANATTDALYGDTTMPWYDPRRYTQSSSQTRAILRGDSNVEGLGRIGAIADRQFAGADGTMKRFADMTPAEQTQAIRDLSFELQLTGGRQGIAADQIGKSIEGLKTQIPGGQPVDPWSGVMSEAPPASTYDRYFNPLAQQGLAADEDKWLGAIYGSDLSRYVEGQNRLAPWLTLMKQGYSPEEAAKIVKGSQVDYTKLSPTERDYLRRIFPFYSFSKGAMQHYGQELLNRPGGMTGQALQLAGSMRDDNALVPEHIAETAAIPLGRSEDGSDAYVSGFGLGFEDVASLAVPAMNMDPQGLGRELMSRTNPLLKGAVEGITGYSTFQRGPMGARALEDMDPTIGRTLSNISDLATGERTPEAQPFISPEVEFAFANSPFARLGTFARTVTDPRKIENPLYLASNLGTGIKVSQVSEPARLNIESQRIARELRDAGGRNFSTPYLPDYKKEGMSQEELSEVEALLARLKEITKRRKELRLKKEQKEKKG